MAATIRSGLAPSFSIALTVASTMPESAPRQPACAAPMTPALASQNRTGAQSAVRMPMARPGFEVTMASASGRAFHGFSATIASAPCFWNTVSSAVRLDAQQFGDARAILRHVLRGVARAWPAIERGIDAGGNAALAREEAMAHAGSVEAGRRELHLVGRNHEELAQNEVAGP